MVCHLLSPPSAGFKSVPSSLLIRSQARIRDVDGSRDLALSGRHPVRGSGLHRGSRGKTRYESGGEMRSQLNTAYFLND